MAEDPRLQRTAVRNAYLKAQADERAALNDVFSRWGDWYVARGRESGRAKEELAAAERRLREAQHRLGLASRALRETEGSPRTPWEEQGHDDGLQDLEGGDEEGPTAAGRLRRRWA